MGRAFARVVPDALTAVVVLALTWPMWTAGGYGLARDMVFTPRAPWTLDAIGMGTSLPRAVPLDAVLALATSLVDGAVVFRLAVAGVLLLAGWGAHRLVADLVPGAAVTVRGVVAVAAVWNPYVVERLALGQWALLAGYAALWWLLPAVRRVLAGDWRGWPAVVAWTWLGSLTPTGGATLLLVALCGVGVALRRRVARGRALAVAGVTLAAQLPWLLPGVLGTTAATSAGSGVDAFAARAERAGGVWLTLLGTGGLWSPFQVPGSLTTWFGHLLTVAVVVALVAGGPRVARGEPALAAAAVVGVALAGIAHLPGGPEALTWAVGHLPGAGLLRDGQKWLLPYVVALVAAAGVATARAEAALRRRDADLGWLLMGVVVLPVLLVPDAAGRTWAALQPVRYPADLAAAVAVLDDAGGASTTGDAVSLPWSSYRRYSWGNPLSAADPLPRWTRHRTVVSDSLVLPGAVVEGEDPRAAEVGAVVTDPGRPLAEPLAGLGVGWVLVYRDQPGAADLDTTGLTVVVDGPDVALYRVPDVVATRSASSGPSTASVVAVAAVDVLWGAAWLAALVAAAVVGRWRRTVP